MSLSMWDVKLFWNVLSTIQDITRYVKDKYTGPDHHCFPYFQVGWLKAKDQTILALHHRVITHNNRFDVDHDENRIWKLKIRSVQESDAGCYMCQINTEVMKKQVGCIDVLSKISILKCS